MDLIDVDVPENMLSSEVHGELRIKEFVSIVNDNIKKQYIQLDNLGQNVLATFDNDLRVPDKLNILGDLVAYVNDNLISIVNIDDLDNETDRLLKTGTYVYEFICVDSYSSLIPALMELLGLTSVGEFDELINTKYLNSPAKFKTDFLSTIQITLDQLMKLKSITPVIDSDPHYQRLLGKYFYYQELVEYGDMEMFMNNFVRPVMSKYSGDLIWKLL